MLWRSLFVASLVNDENADILEQLKAALAYSSRYNSEQVSAKLLYEITKNTGFETKKGKRGECFLLDCCDWQERQADDICGLDDHRLSLMDKMKSICEKSVMKDALRKAGM